ncbi:sensor histidine kinase [Halarcobacter anaerophilus]|uniref:histidine kinase n=1 Tax=Halarcobacter anaerophilus TaxID=877500 RepID=A0A4Q0XWH5_9BACT|nr:histidine kinase dimerization/phosphoacceptor domain -containing protein [Halarcobacter anaerophilus]QDF28736.1 PAS sensor-containing two-component system histidine kinase [Halarcobacter anaerophilus]RXJ61897.1 histidine kinase [Halarcobacter anaerophilus]
MFSFGKYFFNKNKIARRFSFSYVFTGFIGLLFLDKLVQIFFEHNDVSKNGIFTFGLLFIISTGILLYFMINHMQKVIRNIEKAYNDLKQKEKDRLAPYEFALDHSVDAIHWFTLEGKFTYVNEATCKLDGYTKEEFENMYLEDVDINFTRETSPLCMNDIRTIPNWRIESTHRRKDGTTYPVEVSGHAFIYNGKEYICAFARDMTQRIENRNKITKMNEELQKSVKEKEILLKEIHHRVKNNMEIISSLLNMQAYKSEDEKFKEQMKESRSKIHAMALVHEFLYLGKNLAYINVNEYIERLVDDIKELYISNNTQIEVDLSIDKMEFSINRCIQVGMLLHELCVNAFKYAFKSNRKNLLYLRMKIEDENIHVIIKDNGEELKDLDKLRKSDSIGMQLIESIVDFQLHGTIEFKNNSGLECSIIFPKKEVK